MTHDMTKKNWQNEWNSNVPLPRPKKGDCAWLKGWLVGQDVPGGAKSWWKPVMVASRRWCGFYRVRLVNGRHKWVRWHRVYAVVKE